MAKIPQLLQRNVEFFKMLYRIILKIKRLYTGMLTHFSQIKTYEYYIIITMMRNKKTDDIPYSPGNVKRSEQETIYHAEKRQYLHTRKRKSRMM